MTKERGFDLQDRFIDYAVRIIKLSEALPEIKNGQTSNSSGTASPGDR